MKWWVNLLFPPSFLEPLGVVFRTSGLVVPCLRNFKRAQVSTLDVAYLFGMMRSNSCVVPYG